MSREFLGDTLAALPPRDMSLPPGTRAPTIERPQAGHGTVGISEDSRTPRQLERPSSSSTKGQEPQIIDGTPELHPYHGPPVDPILFECGSHAENPQLREPCGSPADQQAQSRSASVQAAYVAGSPIDTASTISASPGPPTPRIATSRSTPLHGTVEHLQHESAVTNDTRRQHHRQPSFNELGEDTLRAMGWDGLSEEHRQFYRRLYEVDCLPGFPRER